MSLHDPNPLFDTKSVNFHNIDQFNEFAKSWDRECRKLKKGNEFEVNLHFINAVDFRLVEINIQSILEQKGNLLKNMRSFLIPCNDHQSFYWRGSIINGNQIGIYPLDSEMTVISNSGYNVYVVYASETIIINKAAKMQLDWNSLIRDLQKDHIILDHSKIQSIRQQIRLLFNLKKMPLPEFQSNLLFEELKNNLLNQLILSCKSIPDGNTSDKSNRLRVFHKVRDYVFSNSTLEFRMDDLCEYAAASERTLQYAVKHFTGLTPLEYIKAHKLNFVRESLLKGDATNLKIRELACNYGFWHSSQFAIDYKNLFGERPSETLKRRC